MEAVRVLETVGFAGATAAGDTMTGAGMDLRLRLAGFGGSAGWGGGAGGSGTEAAAR